jgi:hypothetical protein
MAVRKPAKKPIRSGPKGRAIRTPLKERVVQLVSEGLSISGACREAGVGRSTLYEWQQIDPAFKDALDQAYAEGTHYLEDNLTTRALRGDTTASIFLLKGRAPAKYRERYEVAGNVTGTLKIEWGSEGARPETPSMQKAMAEDQKDV